MMRLSESVACSLELMPVSCDTDPLPASSSTMKVVYGFIALSECKCVPPHVDPCYKHEEAAVGTLSMPYSVVVLTLTLSAPALQH